MNDMNDENMVDKLQEEVAELKTELRKSENEVDRLTKEIENEVYRLTKESLG